MSGDDAGGGLLSGLSNLFGGGGDSGASSGGGNTSIGPGGQINVPEIIPTGPNSVGPNPLAGPSPADLTAGTSVAGTFGDPTTASGVAGPSFNDLLAVPNSGTIGSSGLGFSSLPGMTTSNASLTTPGSDSGLQPGAGGGVTSIGGGGTAPNFSQLTAGIGTGGPAAAGGATAVTDTSGAGTGAAASPPVAGASAGSLAPAGGSGGSGGGNTPADATSSWADKLKSALTNPSTLLAAGGLGYNIFQGQKSTANQTALTDLANAQNLNSKALTSNAINQVGANNANAAPVLATGESLINPLATGNLPPQYQTIVDNAIQDAKTNAISNAAKNGQSTDPTQNTSLAQALANIDNQRSSMTAQVAQQLASTGSGLVGSALGVGNSSASSLLSGGQGASGLSGSLYTTLTGIDTTQANQTAAAIAKLAAALNGGTNTTQKAA